MQGLGNFTRAHAVWCRNESLLVLFAASWRMDAIAHYVAQEMHLVANEKAATDWSLVFHKRPHSSDNKSKDRSAQHAMPGFEEQSIAFATAWLK